MPNLSRPSTPLAFGIYEQLLNKLLIHKLNQYDRDRYYIEEYVVDKAEAAKLLADYLSKIIKYTLDSFSGDTSLEKQIELSNKIIFLLRDAINQMDIEETLIDSQGKMLRAFYDKMNSSVQDFKGHITQITPYSGLLYSELFTGSNSGLSIESEIRKEILSSDKICWLVSFIRLSGINIFRDELRQFTERGGKLQIITTSYMGATEFKAIEFLSKLPNTEVKISYNTKSDRLHAKAYLFLRESGFDTGYVGSSNLSKSALTNGLEWNLKITTNEISHVLDKFKKTFDTYWEDGDFELFNPEIHSDKLKEALSMERNYKIGLSPQHYFDIKPFPYQQEILEKIQTERELHHRYKNLIVAATGTGKTVIAAFDFRQFYQKNPQAKLLFIAHRKEILEQSLLTFRGVLKDNNFGDLWVDGERPSNFNHVFASIQTFNRNYTDLRLSADFYNFIIIDEAHHQAADSYDSVMLKFQPEILLGLTATPERHDGKDILQYFDGIIAAEIRLPDALNRKLLSPFVYFGLTDSIDLSQVKWSNGKYDPMELTKLYTAKDKRVSDILVNVEKYLNDPFKVKALGFCVTQDHSQYMAEKFTLAGYKADFLTSNHNSVQRNEKRENLRNGTINFLFVVDIFNEGVDIEEIDTILFLRPTESLTVFLQQLGRGLRIYEGKEQLTVLDFVGHSRKEYDFESKFRALVGKTNHPIKKEVKDDFPHMPVGCSIILEQKAKEYILENINNAIYIRKSILLEKLRLYAHQTNLALNLGNFLKINNLKLEQVYKFKSSWSELLHQAGKIGEYDRCYESEIYRAISTKWMVTSSLSYFEFILKLARKGFKVTGLTAYDQPFALMLYYDVWQDAGQFSSFDEAIQAIGTSQQLITEIIEFLEIRIDQIDYFEKPIVLPYLQPLKVHARYTRDQILAAFGFSSFQRKSPSREGVAERKEINTELLFIDLKKSDKDFSPTTLYDDYAINELLFHWQSQNASTPEMGRGLSYIEHEENEKIILLFVREEKNNEWGNTQSYVFLGDARYLDHSGSKPMSIRWELSEPIPAYLWKASAKMAVG